MDIPIKHIIGTVALIGLVITAGLVYTTITSFIETDINKQQLKQISENVALNLVEMINLIKFANYSFTPMIKTLDLPTDLGGKAYAIQLNATEQDQDYYVHSYLITREDVSADSLIPYKKDPVLQANTTLETYDFTAGADNTAIISCGRVYGGNTIVVWGQAKMIVGEDDIAIRVLEVGIGWKPTGGG